MRGSVFGDRGLGLAGDSHPLWSTGYTPDEEFLIVGASAVGKLHLARGLPRDDAFLVRSIGPWIAVAVSDGVGSRPLSRFGSTYAVEALTAALLQPFAPSLRIDRAVDGAEPAKSGDSDRVPPHVHLHPELLSNVVTELLSVARQTGVSTDLQNGGSVGWWLPERAAAAAAEPAPTANPLATQRLPLSNRSLSAADVAAMLRSRGLPANQPDLVTIMRKAFRQAYEGLVDHSRRLDVELGELGCTALALLFNRETGQYAAGQIGDGAILGLKRGGEAVMLANAPEPSQGDAQLTYTLTRRDFEKYLDVSSAMPAEVDPMVGFYVMTDGVSGDLLYANPQAAWAEWARHVRENLLRANSAARAVAGMLNWLAGFQVQGSWDDRTLVVITHREGQQ